MRKQDLSPQEFMQRVMSFSSYDWANNEDTARLYGIILGWSDDSINELADKFGWDRDDVILLNVLHVRFEALREVPPK